MALFNAKTLNDKIMSEIQGNINVYQIIMLVGHIKNIKINGDLIKFKLKHNSSHMECESILIN
jgi:hypothetical protein